MRVTMLGKGWFPDQLGGLNRYYRELLEHLPEARGVLLGPANDAPERVRVVSHHTAPLIERLSRFTRAAKEEASKGDLVDAHFALYAVLPLLASGLGGKPLVVHFQGPWADENVAAGDTSRWRQYARRRLECAVYARAAVVVTLTGAFRRLLIERYGISPWDTVVIPPGVNLARFATGDRAAARERFRLPPDAFVVCCARRLVPRMGLDVLLEAAQELSGDSRLRLLIAGDGELRSELQRQVAADPLARSVSLLGRVSDDELIALYRAADVNVVPSTSFEGYGLVVLEAAACGTPSIVARTGGLPEAVGGLAADLTVPTSNARALAERLKHAMLGQLPSREETRAWAEEHSWDRVAQTHRELFDRMTASNRAEERKLRVVYLDHVAQLSGGELALLRLVKALTDVDAHVVLAEEGLLVERLLQAGISVEVLPLHARVRQMRKDRVQLSGVSVLAITDTLLYSLRLARRLRQLRPDVVHTNSLKAGIYGSIAARLAGLPLVWHLRDRIDSDYLPKAGVLLVRTFTRHLPHVVVSNSRTTRQTLAHPERALVVPSLVGLPPLSGRPAVASSSLVVGMISRLAPWKGQDVFLRAFARAFPEGGQRAVIVGAPLFGERELAYLSALHRLARDLGIAFRVDFRGEREDIAAELSSMDVLVHASVIPEPFGQVVVEGMSAQLPVVASRAGGPEEIITHGVDGLLYPQGDVTALAQILVRLDADPELRVALAHAASARARDYSPAVVTRQVMLAYSLAQRHAAAARNRDRTHAIVGTIFDRSFGWKRRFHRFMDSKLG